MQLCQRSSPLSRGWALRSHDGEAMKEKWILAVFSSQWRENFSLNELIPTLSMRIETTLQLNLFDKEIWVDACPSSCISSNTHILALAYLHEYTSPVNGYKQCL